MPRKTPTAPYVSSGSQRSSPMSGEAHDTIIEWEWGWVGEVEKVTIEWRDYEPPRVLSFTPAEYGACPAQFRCFLCQEMKGKKHHFAGEIRFQRICRECQQYADDWTVRAIINHDLKHGKIVRMYPRPKHGKYYSVSIVSALIHSAALCTNVHYSAALYIGRDGKHLDQWELARRWRRINLPT